MKITNAEIFHAIRDGAADQGAGNDRKGHLEGDKQEFGYGSRSRMDRCHIDPIEKSLFSPPNTAPELPKVKL